MVPVDEVESALAVVEDDFPRRNNEEKTILSVASFEGVLLPCGAKDLRQASSRAVEPDP